jgi:hypothetical protein
MNELQPWPLAEYPWFCWDGNAVKAIGIVSENASTVWIASLRPDNSVEFLDMGQVFDSSMFYASQADADKELES